MATFPSITPQYSTQETVNQENIVVKLGDGYQQRFVEGLPANKRLINLTLTFNVSTTDATTIDTFLDARFDDQANFDFTPPHHSSALKFVCTRRSRTAILDNRVVMNLTFEEVAEP
jgi:phage-related protein